MSLCHRQRAQRWTIPAKRRRAAGIPHPIEDFLFTYYPITFSKLEQWHPGIGQALEFGDASPPQPYQRDPYRRRQNLLFADPATLQDKARARLVWTRDLLDQTNRRAPNFSCHGLHEWAMVYRGSQIRHEASTPLRLPQGEIDEVVESRPICCSHFDAFRFFHPETLPLNRLQPSLLERADFEQPGCIHANMDLYKWATKTIPWTGSDLLFDCFELAMELRELDMRASPYDLSQYGLEPVRIETSQGRGEYECAQRELASKSSVLRESLISKLDLALFTLPSDSTVK